jgi:predicted DCC family thiol-disulfide oxidoreductase YuxK
VIVTPIESDAASEVGPVVVYDSDCPFSAVYVRLVRLRRAAGPVTLVDARGGGGHPVLGRLREAGFDPDGGMVVALGGRLHQGAEAMTVLALLTSPHGLFARAMAWAFRSPARARLFFPPLLAGRRLARRLSSVRRGGTGRA